MPSGHSGGIMDEACNESFQRQIDALNRRVADLDRDYDCRIREVLYTVHGAEGRLYDLERRFDGR
jgi:hypothetical protein